MLLALTLTLSVLTAALGLRCHEGGHDYDAGDAWVGEDGCKACWCSSTTNSTLHCTNIKCGSKGVAGTRLCFYRATFHSVGDTWTVEDRCNHCTCLKAGGMTCTNKPCAGSVFDKPLAHGGFLGNCRYNGLWYAEGAHFQASDGCNTCKCSIPGNFASFPLCTTFSCDHVAG